MPRKFDKTEYDKQYHKDRVKAQNEIGDLPPVKDPGLRERALADLQVFMTEFFGDLFPDPFGRVQVDSIKHEQRICEAGSGRLNKLEPRGYGKSTRSVVSAIWAVLKGVQKFVIICCDSTEKSDDLLKLANDAVSNRQGLLDCFPELHCFWKLEGNPHRGQYQLYKGKKTNISIKGDTICFPELPGFASSGALIVARPFKKTRGKNVKGKRPTLVILDDIQTSEEAISPTSISKNLKTLYSDIAFTGSRKRQAAIINNATIIAPNDFAHQLSKNRAFVTVRYKMVDQMPDDLESWEIYRTIRSTYDEAKPGDDERAKIEALAYYQENREKMDAGSSVTWDYAFSPAAMQVSTIQAAMDFIADFGLEAFESECQNDPQEYMLGEDKPLKAEDVEQQVSKLDRLVIPEDHDLLVGMIDVSEKVLWWKLIAVRKSDFSTFVPAYGVYPDQPTNYVTLNTVSRTMKQKWKGDFSAVLASALDDLVEALAGRAYKNEVGADVHLSGLVIDSGWGPYASDIYKFCRRSKYKNILRPSKGMGVGAKRQPLVDPAIRPKCRESVDGQWKFVPTKSKVYLFLYDTNFWKSKVNKMLRQPPGSSASFTYHSQATGLSHRMVAEQMVSEKADRVEANGRTVDEWTCLPGRDNHYLDAAVGSLALAHSMGARFPSRRLSDLNPKAAKPGTEQVEDTPVEGRGEKTAVKKKRKVRKGYSITF